MEHDPRQILEALQDEFGLTKRIAGLVLNQSATIKTEGPEKFFDGDMPEGVDLNKAIDTLCDMVFVMYKQVSERAGGIFASPDEVATDYSTEMRDMVASGGATNEERFAAAAIFNSMLRVAMSMVCTDVSKRLAFVKLMEERYAMLVGAMKAKDQCCDPSSGCACDPDGTGCCGGTRH